MIMYSKHQTPNKVFIDIHEFHQVHFWEKRICRVEARHSSNYSDCSFLMDYNLFKVCFICISRYLITICHVRVNGRIVETKQSIFIQVFLSFNNNSNTSSDFAWKVVDMILPCKLIVYDYSNKFGFTCFTYSFIVYHKINFCWRPLLWENHIMRLLYI